MQPTPLPPMRPPPPRSLRSLPRACLAAVTALACMDDADATGSPLLLVAQSSTLRLYRIDAAGAGGPGSSAAAATMLDSMRVFDGQRIHGIRCITIQPNSSSSTSDRSPIRALIVWGGKECAILQLHTTELSAAQSPRSSRFFSRLWSFPPRSDTVWDACLLRCGPGCPASASPSPCQFSDFEIALGYANDRVEVLAFTVNATASDLSTLQLTCSSPYPQLQCADRSLLYSMRFQGGCRHRLLAIGGTVFCHILLWDASLTDDQAPATATTAIAAGAVSASSTSVASASFPRLKPLVRTVLHRLQGHEGVIFRVDCLPDVAAITSVSDDRALRIWRWTANKADAAASGTIIAASTAASPCPAAAASAAAPQTWSTLVDPSAGSFVCTAALYEHRARVWRCLMPSEWPLVISASEDGSSCVWHAHTGELLTRLSGQRGSVWSLAPSAAGVLAMGAADGTVRLHDLKSILRKAGQLLHTAEADFTAASASSEDGNERVVVLRVAELGCASHALSASSSTLAESLPTSSLDTPPSKRARVGSAAAADASALAATGDPMLDVPAAIVPQVDAGAAAAPSAAKSPAVAKKKPAPAAPAVEHCRELLLDAADGDHAAAASPSLFLLTSFGRVMKLALAPAVATVAPLSVDSLASRAQLLHHHTVSSAPLVSLALSCCKSVLAMGDQRGNLLLVSSNLAPGAAGAASLWTPGVHASATAFVHWFPAVAASNHSSSSTIGRLLTGDAIGEVKLWAVSRNAAAEFELRLGLTFKLPIKARVTCALVVPLRPDEAKPEGELLLLGDSRGSVYLYSLLPATSTSSSSSSAVAAASSASAIQAWALVRLVESHDKCAVSSLTLEPSPASSSASTAVISRTIWSTGRNGSVIEYVLTSNGSTGPPSEDGWVAKHNGHALLPAVLAGCSLVKRRVHKISALSSVESLSFSAPSASDPSRLLVTVHGFHASCLVRWDLSAHAEERRWDIGGPSRSWSRSQGGWMAYTRHAAGTGEGEIVLHAPSSSSSSAASSSVTGPLSIGTPIHARLTTSLVCIPTRSPYSSLIVTGSEDNSVKIYSAVQEPDDDALGSLDSPAASTMTCLSTVADHPDVVRCLALSSESLQSHLLFSAGGRDSLFATRIRVAGIDDRPSVAVDSLGSISSAHATSAEAQAKKESKTKTKSWIPTDAGSGADASSASLSSSSAAAPPLADDRLSQLDLRIMALTAFKLPAHWMQAEAAASDPTSPSPASSSLGSGVHLIALGNSAGVLQIYLFSPLHASESARFRLVAQSSAHSFTILCMTHLSFSRDVVLFSGDTNGTVLCWSARSILRQARAGDAPLNIAPLHSFVQHQSGVDCMAALALASPSSAMDRFALFSGGDDTALSVCGASLVYDEAITTAAEAPASPVAVPSVSGFQCRLVGGWSVVRSSAHASAIRSLALHASSRRLYSAGYDERIKVWRIHEEPSVDGRVDSSPSAIVLQLIGSCFADVMDVTTLRVISEHEGSDASESAAPSPSPLLALAGQGWQLLQIAE